jgi:hypothetical protein
MSDNVIPFNNSENEEESCCELCDLTIETIGYVYETASTEELFNVLREFADECKRVGVKEYLISELDSKAELLDHLEYGCCNDVDCDC